MQQWPALVQARQQVALPPGLAAFVDEAPQRRRDELRNTGWVRHTLESAVWALLTTSNFEEAAIQAAEQRVQAATETVAQIRTETTARVGQLETTLQQLRYDTDRQLAEAQQRFETERQRGEASEARLLAMLDQLRAEQAGGLEPSAR